VRSPFLLLALIAAPLGAQQPPDTTIYLPQQVQPLPRRVAGPATASTPQLLQRHAQGRVIAEVIIDTSGRVEPASINIVDTPDPAFEAPVRDLLLVSRFTTARIAGRPVRVQLFLPITVGAPPASTTEMITAARALTAARRPDSALAVLAVALDPGARPGDGERVYGLLARGIAEAQLHRDSAARRDFTEALALEQEIRSRGTDLAPFLLRLADSVRATRGQGRRAQAGEGMVVISSVEVRPELLSRPAVRFPPEARQLGVSGTVVVEVRVDTFGHPEPATVRIVASVNPLLEPEARRVVLASRYRPAREGGRVVEVVIRQPVRFVP
jgi:TonB family protein